MRALLVLLAAMPLLAGCAGEGGIGFARDEGAHEPYYKEYRELMAGEHHKAFEVPVDEGALVLNVTLALETRDQGLQLPGAPLAQLRVTLRAPDGATLAEGSVDPRSPRTTLLAQTPAPGAWSVEVEGVGASQAVEGKDYGASYLLSAEVLYAG